MLLTLNGGVREDGLRLLYSVLSKSAFLETS